jgi:DNA-binding FadR family transcriptional regulator
MYSEKQSTSDIVYKAIEKKILDQDWRPGEKISSEKQLSLEFGVSRVSVREATEKMVALNVLSKKQGGGTFVNELSASIYLNGLIPMILLEKDNLMDILEFRRVLEVESAKMCAERRDEKIVEKLEECYQEMCLHQNKSKSFSYADYNFHMTIARGTGNSLIIKINSILTDLWKFHQIELNKFLGPKGGVHEHKKILDAIRDGDSELASLYMKRHIDRTINEINEIKNLKVEE